MEIEDIQLNGRTLLDLTVKKSFTIPDGQPLKWTFKEAGSPSAINRIYISTTCTDSYEENLSPGPDERDETIEVSVVFHLEEQKRLEYHYFYQTYHHEHKRANRPLRKSYWICKLPSKESIRWRGRWSKSRFSRLKPYLSSQIIQCLKQIVKHLYFPLHEEGKFAIDNRWMGILKTK